MASLGKLMSRRVESANCSRHVKVLVWLSQSEEEDPSSHKVRIAVVEHEGDTRTETTARFASYQKLDRAVLHLLSLITS